MSFEQIKNTDTHSIHPRICIILNAFNAQEIKQLKNIARLTGISEQILTDDTYGETIVKDLLENPSLTPTCLEQHTTQKAIIFNNVPSNRMNAFIEGLKKCRMNRPLMAVTTQNSISWTLNELLGHLISERLAFQTNSTPIHE